MIGVSLISSHLAGWSQLHGSNQGSVYPTQPISNQHHDKHLIFNKNIQSGPDKIAQSLMHRQFATFCSIIRQFSPKC